MNFGDIFNIKIQDGNHSDKEYIGDDPAKFMNMAFSYKEEKDWDSAIDFLKKSFDAFEKSPLEYPYDFNIQDFLRLPYICTKEDISKKHIDCNSITIPEVGLMRFQ